MAVCVQRVAGVSSETLFGAPKDGANAADDDLRQSNSAWSNEACCSSQASHFVTQRWIRIPRARSVDRKSGAESKGSHEALTGVER